MLQTNQYVAIIHVDYSKAFDTVSHSSLMLKMCTIDLSDQTYNWVVNYFNQRAHIRPPSFIVEASDLHPLYTFNPLMKYADDSYLLVGSRHISTATEEFDHV